MKKKMIALTALSLLVLSACHSHKDVPIGTACFDPGCVGVPSGATVVKTIGNYAIPEFVSKPFEWRSKYESRGFAKIAMGQDCEYFAGPDNKSNQSYIFSIQTAFRKIANENLWNKAKKEGMQAQTAFRFEMRTADGKSANCFSEAYARVPENIYKRYPGFNWFTAILNQQRGIQ